MKQPPAQQAVRSHRSAESGRPGDRAFVLLCICIAAAALLPYLQTMRHGFIEYDDNQYVTQNEVVKRGLTLEGVQWAFTTITASNWHPITWLSHMIDVELWGTWAGGHHLTNSLLHAANALLLFIVLRTMTGSQWRSAMVAFVFAVHPLHVESVAWVAERKDVLSTCFGLLALIAYVKYVKQPSLGRYALIALAFGSSLMCKPMLVTLPLVFLLLDYWPLQRLSGAKVAMGIIVEKIPLLLMSIGSSVITIVAQQSTGAMHALETLPIATRLANAIVAYGTYLAKTVWPVNLAVIYPLTKLSVITVTLSLIILVVISGAVIVLSRRRPHVLVGWLWFLGTLVPVIGLVQVGSQAMADRYMYVPMIGLLIMALWSIPEVRTVSRGADAVLNGIAAAAIIVLGVLSWIQVSHWKSTATLFAHAIAVTDNNVFAHNVLGHALHQEGRINEAHEHLSIALRLNPDYAPIHNNIAHLLLDEGRNAEAQAHFEQSLILNDQDAVVWNNLGNAVLAQGRPGEAEANYRRALELKPDFAEALVNLGRAIAAQGRPDEAIASYQRAIELRPDLAIAHANLGAALWNLRRTDEAIAAYQSALRYDPNAIDTRVNLGVAFASQGKTAEAIVQFEHALGLDPARADARQFLEFARRQHAESAARP